MQDTETPQITDSHVRFADPHAVAVWNGVRTAPPEHHATRITIKCRCKQTRICPSISVSRSLGLFPDVNAMRLCRRVAINQRSSEILIPHSAFWKVLGAIMNDRGSSRTAYFPFSFQKLTNQRWVLSYVADALEVVELGWEDVVQIFEGEVVKIVVILWWNEEDRGKCWETYMSRDGDITDLASRFAYDCEEDLEAGILRSPREYSPKSAKFSRILWRIIEQDDQADDPTWKIGEENLCDKYDDTIDRDRNMETDSEPCSCTPTTSPEPDYWSDDSEPQPRTRRVREAVAKRIRAGNKYLQISRHPQTGGKRLPASMFFSGKRLPALEGLVGEKKSQSAGKRVRFSSETSESVTTEAITEDDDEPGFDSDTYYAKHKNDDEYEDELSQDDGQRDLGSETAAAESILADDIAASTSTTHEGGIGELTEYKVAPTNANQEGKLGELPKTTVEYTVSRGKNGKAASTCTTQLPSQGNSAENIVHFDSLCEKDVGELLQDFQLQRWLESRKRVTAKDLHNIVSAFFGDYAGSEEDFEVLMEKAGITLLNY
ncbi:hypothetical protein BJ742DRAFT_234866 [Cladochytrium replicatum]|nr:hypothetical protein BJ742DRAFT_234866 [Cladochytrium replicatum]